VHVQQIVEWSIKFAGLVSPWWMIPAMMVAVGATLWLYRNQCQALPVWQRAGLIGLRVFILLVLIFLAFKPSLISRRILTYPGRILMLLDDSASMTAHDTALSDTEALRIARQLGQLSAAPESLPDALAQTLENTLVILRTFERYSRMVDRKQDTFWDKAGSVRTEMSTLLDQVIRDAATIPGVTAGEKSRLENLIRSTRELKAGLDVFFTGGRDPGGSAYDDYESRVALLRQELLNLQAGLDERSIAAGNVALKAAAATVRSTSRIELVRAKLARLQPGLQALAPGQAIQMVSLMEKTRTDLNAFRSVDLKAKEGPTDLTGCLKELVTEPSEFPLTAIMLISDGRNLGDVPLRKVTQEAVSRQIPVYTAGAGSEREPGDLAIVSVRAPSFAVKGVPMRVQVEIRDSMATTDVSRLQIFLKGVPVVSDSVNLTPGVRTAILEFTPADSGFFKYTVKLDSVAGEVFPIENNSVDFITNVREDKVRVLFLDWKPRWETRFALNILQRLPYIDLNSMIALVQEGSKLQRGLQKGTWPESAEALHMYDLIILGDLPGDLLSRTELESLRQWVAQKGKTLCVIGAGRSLSVGNGTPLADVLGMPSAGSTGDVTRVVGDGAGEVQLTAEGRVHVLTRAVAQALLTGEQTNLVELAITDGLVLSGEGKPSTPLMTVRYAGAGKTLGILSDDLWRQLHPAALEAHTELYAGLVTWSLEGGFRSGGAGKAAAELAVDARRYPPGAIVEVWLRGGMSNSVIEAVRGNDVIASAGVTSVGNGMPACAHFPGLPAGEIVFRLKDRPGTQSERIEIFEDKRERTCLARDSAFLRDAALSTGARYVEFGEVEKGFQTLTPRQRTETHERVWRLWGFGPLLGLLVLALTAQWIWRKWVGLV